MRLRKLLAAAVVAVASVTALAGVAEASPAAPAKASSTYQLNNIWLSTYTWWNNSPPGAGIEYAKSYGFPTLHNVAGGSTNNSVGAVGTWANPISYAAQNSGVFNLKPGTRVYIPFFQKYFILEDLCATCYTAQPQMDLWVGGVSKTQEGDQSNHDIVNLWRRRNVIVNPPSNEPVNTIPLYKVKI